MRPKALGSLLSGAQIGVGARGFLSAHRDLLFQVLAMACQLEVPGLNLDQHIVKGFDQRARLIVAVGHRAARKILAS